MHILQYIATLKRRIPALHGGDLPPSYRSNFTHLYFDIAWFGLLTGSAMAFVAIYAARQGAEPWQIGLLSAAPGVVNLIFTLPSGRWLEKQPLGTAVFWMAVFHRIVYLLWVPLPLLMPPSLQIWMLIFTTLLMSIPGTALAVGFNALFAEAVPPDWRAHVAGTRNAIFAIVLILTSLACGYILHSLPFTLGYQVVFGMGFVGAAMSTLHVWFINPLRDGFPRPRFGRGLGDLAWPGRPRISLDGIRHGSGLRFLVHNSSAGFRFEVLRGAFGRLIAVLFIWHIGHYLAIPLFAVYMVEVLHLSDRVISLGNAVFYIFVFVSSTMLSRMTRKMGHHHVTATGMLMMSSYPVLIALSHNFKIFMLASAMGGFGWSIFSGGLTNFLLERMPADDRPAYLAWYNLALNAAVLLGSLAGPLIAGHIGMATALLVFALARFLAGLLVWRWGRA